MGAASFALPAVAFLLATAGYPLYSLIRMALSDVGPGNVIGGWKWVGLANFTAMLHDSTYWASLFATVKFTGALLVLNLTLGLALALALRRGGRLSSLTVTVMMLVWALPAVASGSVWKFMLQGNGLINRATALFGVKPVYWLADYRFALWSVLFVTSWATLPFCVIIIRAGLKSIQTDTIEAAGIDGASHARVTWHVILPQLRHLLIVLGVLIIVQGFRSFDFIYVMTQGGPGTVSSTLPFRAYQQSFGTFNFSAGAATAVSAMGFVAVLAVVYLRSTREEVDA